MSYGTLAEWRAYAIARGNSAPTDADDAAAGQALLRAQDYIRWTYVEDFYPAYSAESDGVESAVYEAANLELATPNFFSKTYTPSQAKVLTEVKGIKWTPVGSSTDVSPRSTTIESLLRRYVDGPKNSGLYIKNLSGIHDG